MTCPLCDDGEGKSLCPWYGVAPHTHANGPVSGVTVLDGRETWPETFVEDPDVPGLGVHFCECQIDAAREMRSEFKT